MELILALILLPPAYLFWAKSSRNMGTLRGGKLQAEQTAVREQIAGYLREKGSSSKRDLFLWLDPSNLKAKHTVIKTFQVMVMQGEVVRTGDGSYAAPPSGTARGSE